MRWTAGPGSWPACWLLSQGWANTGNCSTPASEIDLMEGQGTEPNAFYGTVHRDSARACAGHLQNGNNWQPAAFALAGQWHTYATLWTASQVCWYIDDVQTHCAPTYADTANSPMFLLLQMWIGGWTSGTNSSTPDELRTEIDWVSVWQR
jgi:beta-glucanase (GH16 family)